MKARTTVRLAAVFMLLCGAITENLTVFCAGIAGIAAATILFSPPATDPRRPVRHSRDTRNTNGT